MVNSHIPHPRIAERAKIGPHLTENEQLQFNGRFAVFITRKFGSMGMFYVLIIWMFGWMILATAGFGIFQKDPYPFTFLLFLSNLIQLFALPILAVGQQVLSRASDKQAEQTFKDTEAILKLQDDIHRLIKINNELTEEIHAVVYTKKNT
ncbi:MAG: DUF1003 domain-containing protein [Candidatus Sungbacteria bacterium]|nr:DUF1003 domain-containing protein [bacterium]MDZ4260658.1 DUF1003 domain-containing protein [Candidatus Sungbacteria bacterium]